MAGTRPSPLQGVDNGSFAHPGPRWLGEIGRLGDDDLVSHGQIYCALTFFFPIPLKWPNSWLCYLNFPVIFSSTGLIPPANSNNYVPWAIVYDCAYPFFPLSYAILTLAPLADVLSTALDWGVAVSAVLIFFILQYPMNGNIGNNTIQHPGVVGEHRVAQHRGREEDAAHCARRRGPVWLVDVVNIAVAARSREGRGKQMYDIYEI
ncbi:hypothetical protein B0H14DRAFT_3433691 [Mycena olivaceomarginata]|nr:hypothetical protein B0H14DRAFT_3433691 [Mycena olivaceomarginata]